MRLRTLLTNEIKEYKRVFDRTRSQACRGVLRHRYHEYIEYRLLPGSLPHTPTDEAIQRYRCDFVDGTNFDSVFLACTEDIDGRPLVLCANTAYTDFYVYKRVESWVLFGKVVREAPPKQSDAPRFAHYNLMCAHTGELYVQLDNLFVGLVNRDHLSVLAMDYEMNYTVQKQDDKTCFEVMLEGTPHAILNYPSDEEVLFGMSSSGTFAVMRAQKGEENARVEVHLNNKNNEKWSYDGKFTNMAVSRDGEYLCHYAGNTIEVNDISKKNKGAREIIVGKENRNTVPTACNVSARNSVCVASVGSLEKYVHIHSLYQNQKKSVY